MVLIADKKIPNRLSRARTSKIKTEVRPTVDNDSYDRREDMMTMEELEATLALISKRIRDLSRR